AIAPPTLIVSPTSGYDGQPITITGTHFGTQESVNIYADGNLSRPLFGATTDTSGTFVLQTTVLPGIYGQHTLTAVGQRTGRSASTTFVQQTVLVLQPTSGAAGTLVGVTGYSFGMSETVRLRWNSPTGGVLASGVTNAQGTFSTFITVPATA